MPAGHGLRSRTRDTFSKARRERGYVPLSTYLVNYKLGDYVDIKVNSAIHKGMPHKWYHGKTGRVWNITKRAVGVEVNKVLGNRQLKKRIHCRVEHIRPSRCRDGFLSRRAENEERKAEANKAGVRLGKELKRKPVAPRSGFALKDVALETVTAIPYDIVKEGLLG